MIARGAMLTDSVDKIKLTDLVDQLLTLLRWTGRQPKTHDYSQRVAGVDYIIEFKEGSNVAIMTTYGRGIRPGDWVVLASGKERYRVETLEYYANPGDMWIALLTRHEPPG